jgi:hypothetical protein
MAGSAQKRATEKYRLRLGERGMGRFEVLGLDRDRELIRALARRLIETDPEASRLRAALARAVAAMGQPKGGVLDALRRSPLVGAELDLARMAGAPRKGER